MQATHAVGLRLAGVSDQMTVKFAISSDWGPGNLLMAAAERVGLMSIDSVRWRGPVCKSMLQCFIVQLEDDHGNQIKTVEDALQCETILVHASQSETFLVSEESLAIAGQVSEVYPPCIFQG